MLPSTNQPSECVYRGVRFDVHGVDLPGHEGGVVRREAVVAAEAVVILPMLDVQTVVLIRNERFAVGQTLWELPAGTIEPGEQPAACAKRELIEESGYEAQRLEKLVAFYPSPGICTERMHAYVAYQLCHVGQRLDPNERITVEAVSLQQSIQMVKDNTIQDGKTIATLLYYQVFLAQADGKRITT